MELSVDSKEHDLSDEGNQMEKCEAKSESLLEVLFQWRLARIWMEPIAYTMQGNILKSNSRLWDTGTSTSFQVRIDR